MKALLLAWVLGFTASVSAAPAAVERELAEAEDLAVRGQQAAAIDAYRSLLERGVDFAELRYNLGTLYLEDGDLGRAVLHLKSAVRMDPRLDDARYNLERALGARADELEGAAREARVGSVVSDLVRSSEASLAFAGTLLVFVFLLGLWPWTQRGTGLRRFCTGALLLSGTAFALAALVLATRVQVDGEREAVILDSEVSARAGPSADAAVAFVAHAGLSGHIVDEESGFTRLRLENGLDAWFPRAALAVVGAKGDSAP